MKNRIGDSNKPRVSRRQLLKLALGASVGGGVALLIAPVASAEEVANCADRDDIFANYDSLNYREKSQIENKACGNCSFFEPEGEENCGYCEMMDGPTDITGYCDSWATKED